MFWAGRAERGPGLRGRISRVLHWQPQMLMVLLPGGWDNLSSGHSSPDLGVFCLSCRRKKVFQKKNSFTKDVREPLKGRPNWPASRTFRETSVVLSLYMIPLP